MLRILKELLLKNSPCRSLQKIESRKFTLEGECLEIGNTDFNKKSFFNNFQLKSNTKLYFADLKKITKSNYIQFNLEKKNNIKKKFDYIVIFNVLEHVYDIHNSIIELKKILKPKGKIFISTPFIYRYHKAPKDYNRYTLDFYDNLSKKNNFKIIYKKNLSTGPFFSAYSIIHNVLYIIYPLNIIFAVLSIMLDKTLFIFNNNIKSLYSICNFIIFYKK